MSLDREFEHYVWCPTCRERVGEIWSAQVVDNGVRRYFTKPDPLPKLCPQCETVVERQYH